MTWALLRRLRLVLAAGWLTACTLGPAQPVQEPSPSVVSLASLLGPTLLTGGIKDDVVCLWARSDDGQTALLLPSGYTVTLAPDLTVADQTGTVVARAGQEVWIGGGYLPIAPEVRQKLKGCIVNDAVWVVGHDGISTTPPVFATD